PGLDIVGAVPLSADPTGYEDGLGGTSFSAPIVAAAAAWLWTVRPALTVTQLGDVLRRSARDIGAPGFDSSSGWGLLDIPAALAVPAGPTQPGGRGLEGHELTDRIIRVVGRRRRAADVPQHALAVLARRHGLETLAPAVAPRPPRLAAVFVTRTIARSAPKRRSSPSATALA